MEYSLVPTHILTRMIKIMDKLEPKLFKDDEEYVDKPTAMKMLKCSRTKLQQLQNSGHIKYTSGGGRSKLYSTESIKEFLNDNCT